MKRFQLFFSFIIGVYAASSYGVTSIPFGDYKYVIDKEKDTLTIYNTTKQQPELVSRLKVAQHPNQITIDGDFVYVISSPHADGSASVLHIIHVKDRAQPKEVGSTTLPGNRVILGAVKDGRVTIHSKQNGKYITLKYLVTDPTNPGEEKTSAEAKVVTATK